MSKDIQKTALRLPRDLHNSIHEAAAASGRTMNAEIVYRLQKTFDDEVAPTDSAPRQYQRKQKYSLQSDMPDEVMQELMARIQEVWDKYKAAQDK
ncbi:Arc family DNA-binding protein [Aeromonas jandaei]|uniref:Arc family DNA-binding protein n=1 Tax=Aeromonas jandaei TaxID=650 RepID=UPI003BA2A63C